MHQIVPWALELMKRGFQWACLLLLAFNCIMQSSRRVLDAMFYFWYLRLALPYFQRRLPSHCIQVLQFLFLFLFLLLLCRSCYELCLIQSSIPYILVEQSVAAPHLPSVPATPTVSPDAGAPPPGVVLGDAGTPGPSVEQANRQNRVILRSFSLCQIGLNLVYRS